MESVKAGLVLVCFLGSLFALNNLLYAGIVTYIFYLIIED